MLKKYSMFTMMLFVAASLIGISSIYQLPGAGTQPQDQLVTPGQLQLQKQPPPIIQQRPLVQIQENPQTTTGNIITKQRQEDIAQSMADVDLVNRIMPDIIKRIDGKTLAQKIDVATLLQKIDGKLLAQKILPHVQVTLRMGDSYSPLVQVNKAGLSTSTYHVTEARCPAGTKVMGGGAQISPGRAPPSSWYDFNAKDAADNNIVALMPIPANRLVMMAKMESTGNMMAYATCLNPYAELTIVP